MTSQVMESLPSSPFSFLLFHSLGSRHARKRGPGELLRCAPLGHELMESACTQSNSDEGLSGCSVLCTLCIVPPSGGTRLLRSYRNSQSLIPNPGEVKKMKYRLGMSSAPAWPPSPEKKTRSAAGAAMAVTIPSCVPSASSSGPCSMCSSTNAATPPFAISVPSNISCI